VEGEFKVIERLLLSAVLVPLLVAGLFAPAAQADDVVVPPQAATSSGGMPYGPFEPDPDDFGSRFTGGWIPLSPSYAINTLNGVQDAGASVAVRLSGGERHFTNSNDTFNLELWKDRIDAWAGTNIDQYIADGTILVHFLIDEPKCRGCWGGEVVPNDVLDEMAAYSKARWPSLATAVRVSPLDLEEDAAGYETPWPGWEWTYLDTAWAQYSARKGNVVDYARAENAAAIEQGLGLIVGLNVINGGDGSSNIPSHPDYTDKSPMSPEELITYTTALIDNTQSCAFVMWRYDFDGYTYFDRSDISQAVDQLGALTASRTPAPCTYGHAEAPRFWDTGSSVFEDDILWLAGQGITAGCNPPLNDRFCPDDVVTRAQMASFLTRALGLSSGVGSNIFVDDDGSVHEDNIDRLGTAGIAQGCNPPANNRFCPDKAVTRAQMAAFLVRALGLTDDGGGNSFIDDNGSVFELDIARFAAAGITLGCNPPVNDRFCPDRTVTRGQMAAFLHRALR
jgi:hypothetical protein